MKKKAFSRIIVVIMALCLVLTAAACGKDKEQPDVSEADQVEDEAYDEDNVYDDDEDYEDYEDEETADNDEEDYTDEEDSADEEDPYTLESDSIGITFHLPEKYYELDGYWSYKDAEVSKTEGAFFGQISYFGLPVEELNELFAKDEMTDEESKRLYDHVVPVLLVGAVTNDEPAESLITMMNFELDLELEEKNLVLIKELGTTHFYKYVYDKAPNIENLEGKFKDEYDELVSLNDELLSGCTYSKPKSSADVAIGTKVSFTTTDLDGNTISSDDIFGQNEITMVNIWATWCGYCVKELPDLEKLNTALEAKNCGVIGLCGDADSNNEIMLAKALLNDAKVTYLNICPFDGWSDVFDMGGVWPASFFVDRSGTIIAAPLFGAKVSLYERYIDDALNGEVSDIPAGQGNSYENSEGMYRIRVVNESMDPVEGAMVQFCSDGTCKMGMTDKDGIATFSDPPGEYEVHVQKLPEGYKKHTTAYKTEKQYSDMVIVVERE